MIKEFQINIDDAQIEYLYKKIKPKNGGNTE